MATTATYEHTVVPKGHVWLLGDNPDESIDSRHYGPVPIGLIQGKAICKLLPLSEMFSNFKLKTLVGFKLKFRL